MLVAKQFHYLEKNALAGGLRPDEYGQVAEPDVGLADRPDIARPYPLDHERGASELPASILAAARRTASTGFGQNIRPPSGTGRSGASSTTSPSLSGKPSTSASDMNLPICFAGKLTTPATWRPTSSSGA